MPPTTSPTFYRTSSGAYVNTQNADPSLAGGRVYSAAEAGLGPPPGAGSTPPPPVVTAQPAINQFNNQQTRFNELQQGVQGQQAKRRGSPDVSIVDYLVSKGQDSSLTGRAKLATKFGLVKSPNEYITLAAKGANGDVNLQLLGILRGQGGIEPQGTQTGGPAPEQAGQPDLSQIIAALDKIQGEANAITGQQPGPQAYSNPPAVPPAGSTITPEVPVPPQPQPTPDGSSIDSYPGEIGQEYNQNAVGSGYLQNRILQNIDQIDGLYSVHARAIDDLRNGVFPLTPSQQALLDATRRNFDTLKAQQDIANKNYTGGVTIAGIASGRNRYAPEIEAGNIMNAVNAGVQKVADIESKAAETLAKLQEGFDDKNFKMIDATYKTLEEQLKLKTEALRDLHNTIIDSERDLRDFNFKVADANIKNMMDSQKFTYQQKKDAIDQAFQQGQLNEQQRHNLSSELLERQRIDLTRWEITDDAFGRPVAFDKKSGTFGNPFGDKKPEAGSLSIGFGLGDVENAFIDAIYTAQSKLGNDVVNRNLMVTHELLKSGNLKTAQDKIFKIGIESLGVEGQKQAIANMEGIRLLNDIKTLLGVYKKQGGDTNLITGSIENIAQKIGQTTDPRLATIGAKMQQAVQLYRKGMSGVAFSPAESKEYYRIFPDIKSVEKLNYAKINSLMNDFNSRNRVSLSAQIGGENYDRIFGNQVKYQDIQDYLLSNPEDAARATNILRDDPNLTDEEIIQLLTE